ncbi:hypothetical protein Taro_036105 [Colocasia esculenta]|uniref:Glycosyl transferase 64 domain-containing protein n=1 Tax=Colocasia esculenta TaxID=4460 RepID=A0A843WCE2_COLES|nr:hypothetical protein [Colocasia esculenta]
MPSKRGYTILINTWKRNNLLKKSVQHYASCSGVDSIHIIWSEADPPSDSLFFYLNRVVDKSSRDDRKIELLFDLNVEDSLNNRFKDIKELTGDAILSIDDDVLFSCHSVEFAFSVWQSAPSTLVGFVPRKIEEMGSSGISSLGGHNERRSRCLNDFVALYGRMPLVATTVKAVEGRDDWFW